MASMNGITVKKIKHWVGYEGDAFQGDLYIDNKKVGFWSQDGDGGCDRFDLDDREMRDELKKRAIEYYTKYPEPDFFVLMSTPIEKVDFNNLPYLKPEDVSLEIFMGQLMDLIDVEKSFKRGAKKGYKGMCVIDAYHTRGPMPEALAYNYTNRSAVEKVVEERKAKYPQTFARYYESLDDFIK